MAVEDDLIKEYADKLQVAVKAGTMVETSWTGVFASFLMEVDTARKRSQEVVEKAEDEPEASLWHVATEKCPIVNMSENRIASGSWHEMNEMRELYNDARREWGCLHEVRPIVKGTSKPF